MAGASYILLTVVVLSTDTALSLYGSLLPLDPVIEVGSDLVLNCILDTSLNESRTSDDVIWKCNHYQAHNEVLLPPDMYISLNDTVSQLTLTNVTISDWCIYVCLFHEDKRSLRLYSEVSVGMRPWPPVLDCVIPSPDAYQCTWNQPVGTYTQIQTRHKFMFKFNGTWVNCPSLRDNTRCNVPLHRIIDANQHVRVTASNDLGMATTEKVFNIYKDVTVNRPTNVAIAKMESETSLRVTWSVPAEWLQRSEGTLMYKLRYKKEECEMANHTCCCWFETQDVVRSKSFILSNLDPYTNYNVQVSARYQDSWEENWSDWSEDVTAITRETAPAETVQDLAVTQTSNKVDPVHKRNVNVYWTSLPDKGQHGILLGYKLVIHPDDVGELSQEHNITNQRNMFTIIGIQRFSGYLVKVAARNRAGTGDWSTISVQDLTTAPNAPDKVRAVVLTTTSIFVEWEEPSQPNGYIENYIVQWGRNNGKIKYYTTSNSSQLSLVINNLEIFALYEVGVMVVNSRGESKVMYVRGGAHTLEGVPNMSPISIEVRSVTNHPDRLMLSWQQPPADNINGVLLGYEISFCKRRLDSCLDCEKPSKCLDKVVQWNLSNPDAVKETLTDLVPSTSYLVWIAAYTAVGVGPDSKPVEGKTAKATQGILLLAIVIPIAILLGLCIFGFCVWQFRHVSDKDSEDVCKKKPCEISNKVHTQVSSPKIAVISGTSVKQDRCQVSKAALQSSTGLELILDSIQLHSKMNTKYVRSVSGDSGIPSSPGNEPVDFSAMGGKDKSIVEEDDDSVFLEDGVSSANQQEMMSKGHKIASEEVCAL